MTCITKNFFGELLAASTSQVMLQNTKSNKSSSVLSIWFLSTETEIYANVSADCVGPALF